MKPPSKRSTDVASETFLFLGVSLIALGILAVLTAFVFTLGTVLVLGALMLAAAVVEVIYAVQMGRRGEHVFLNFMSALLYLGGGGLLLWYPLAGALSLTLIISAFLFVNGFAGISHGLRHQNEPRWGWFVVGGAIDLILGSIIALGWPATGLWVIGLFVGIEMIIYGTTWIAFSFGLKQLENAIS
jgi:uncharacterized membrane protein HdeD (DUF308 family)